MVLRGDVAHNILLHCAVGGEVCLQWQCFFVLDLYIYGLDRGVSSKQGVGLGSINPQHQYRCQSPPCRAWYVEVIVWTHVERIPRLQAT